MRERIRLVGTDRRARLLRAILVNGSLALVLTALYFAVVMLLTQVVHITDVPLIHSLATVIVAVSVIPFRTRILGLANRLMRRKWQSSQELMRDIGAALSRALEPEALRVALIDDLPERLRLKHAVLWMLDPLDEHAFVAIGLPPDSPGATLLANGASILQISHASGYLAVEPTSDSSWTSPFVAQDLRIILPLWAGERLVGLYGCSGPVRGHAIPRHVRDLLLTLAPAIASAIENTRAYATIARLNAQLRKLDQLKDEFIESVGHELRTPLTTLSLAMQLLMNQPGISAQLTQITHTGVVQLQALVDRILTFEQHAHQPAAEQRAATELIDLQALLEEIESSYGPVAEVKGLRLTLLIQERLGVWGVTARLQRALHEVIDNSVRYSDGGEVLVSAQFEDGVAIIRIADQGPGIPQDERDKLFAAFYRGRGVRALADTPGAGLGLSIARSDVEMLGGRIWLDYSGPEGSVICVALPAVIMADMGTDDPNKRARVVGV